MKACASNNTSRSYHRYQRFMRPPLPTHHHRHYSKSHKMSFNGTALRVFINGAWITWIYLFAIFIRLEYVDAKIGKRMLPIHNQKKILMSMCSAFASIQLVFTNRPGLWTFPIPQVHEFKHKHNQCADINISSRLICSNYIQAHTHICIHISTYPMEMDNIRIIQANRQNQIIPLSYMLRVNLLTFTTLAPKRKRR